LSSVRTELLGPVAPRVCWRVVSDDSAAFRVGRDNIDIVGGGDRIDIDSAITRPTVETHTRSMSGCCPTHMLQLKQAQKARMATHAETPAAGAGAVGLKDDNPSFVIHGVHDVKYEDVSGDWPYFSAASTSLTCFLCRFVPVAFFFQLLLPHGTDGHTLP
jgi:hypothetical protein